MPRQTVFLSTHTTAHASIHISTHFTTTYEVSRGWRIRSNAEVVQKWRSAEVLTNQRSITFVRTSEIADGPRIERQRLHYFLSAENTRRTGRTTTAQLLRNQPQRYTEE